jgi:ATP-binding cassette subfamily F protein 3
VSHDRYLIREVCDALISVRNGRVSLHIGVDDAVLSPRTAGGLSSHAGGNASPSKSAAKAAPVVLDKRTDAERRNARHVATRDLTKKLEKLEKDLGKAEADVATLQRQLADPEVYADKDKVKTLLDQHDTAKAKATRLSDAWLTAGEELERVERKFA